ncbi:unnamed protein product [Cuscuta europaea]|uniref:Uncharacterized protein n=1 Tax=Cuscuta europaea TaxID=41803 RepID=A0A9P1EKS2_CUSEU|nr:unnamed protein product [Cuscuta europaea]
MVQYHRALYSFEQPYKYIITIRVRHIFRLRHTLITIEILILWNHLNFRASPINVDSWTYLVRDNLVRGIHMMTSILVCALSTLYYLWLPSISLESHDLNHNPTACGCNASSFSIVSFNLNSSLINIFYS